MIRRYKIAFWLGIFAIFVWIWWAILFLTPGMSVLTKAGYGFLVTVAGVAGVYARVSRLGQSFSGREPDSSADE